jgi:hypothetical protein
MPGRGELGDRYRRAIARFATGVTVVTTCDGERLVGDDCKRRGLAIP